ncbi:Methylenetetrahydrofolate reductase [Mycena indigotica]|uniref:Methylenetetrahydrofolate reductase n=1 Tax=Mycena indigotica TaxID=2126181 RepID=A0A8H6T0P0_9AGAR|nr:Methylenetetrahydrofolate reductase [Mycena indigotica]KAF7309800.1 Methylenetetrahydrofolate reductase [Mycena indigotica]
MTTISPDSSLESLDRVRYTPDDSLLAESLTLSSLSSSTSTTPPIPAGCMVPLSVIIDHHDGPVMFHSSPTKTPSKATLTAPTPPRLRTMMKEKLLIETWLVNMNGVDPDIAGHTPWSGIPIEDPIPWKSEGSLHTPQAFKSSISSARRQTPTQIVVSKRKSNRNALVFEREIILQSNDGKANRVSLQASMEPEVAAIVSELQDLNSFFKQEQSSALPPPPSLIISNSHFSLPVSFESPAKQMPKSSIPLAMRRGKMLPPVSINSLCNQTEYPGMPTAFLGSPSTYSPKFEFASQPRRRSMDLRDMVTSLRSQCASMEPARPIDTRAIEVTPPGTPRPDDEWAFADGILDFYSPSPFKSEFVKKPLRVDLVEYAAESLSTRSSSRAESLAVIPSAPPSTPLPPCPPIQRVSVRSILKSSKSVRFAEEVEVEIPKNPAPEPSPRNSASSKPRELRPRSMLHDPLRSPPPKPLPVLRPRPPHQRRATTPASFGSSSNPASSPNKSRLCVTNTNTNINASSGGSIPASSSTGGRHSLGRVFGKDKENKVTNGRWTLNENVLKRASIHTTTASPVKSRMPVPLRNILTRFK